MLLSVVLNRGALADPAHTLPQDIWDPSLVSYLIAWDGYALLHHLGSIWHLNAFYPAPYGLAYTDSLLGYAPFAIVGTGPEAAVFRYNVLYILAEALVLFGGYALARQLGLGRAGPPWSASRSRWHRGGWPRPATCRSCPPAGCSWHWRCSRADTGSGGVGP